VIKLGGLWAKGSIGICSNDLRDLADWSSFGRKAVSVGAGVVTSNRGRQRLGHYQRIDALALRGFKIPTAAACQSVTQ